MRNYNHNHRPKKQSSRSVHSAISCQRGFTIIELMIATTVFSVIMLILTIGVIQLSRVYYRGITTTNTQNTTRNVMNNISQALQFNSGSFAALNTPNNGSLGFCLGNIQYSYLPGYQLVTGTPSGQAGVYQSNHVLVENDNVASCSGTQPQDLKSGAFSSGSKELMSPRMRLSSLSITPQNSGLFAVSVRIVYGDDDLLSSPSNGPTAACKLRTGDQFCAVSNLSTTVQQRIQ